MLRIQAHAPHENGRGSVEEKKWRGVWPGCSSTAWLARPRRQAMPVGTRNHATGIVLAIIALTPLVVIPFARVLENERITAKSLAGGAIAVAGVWG
jgi:hypothetical protein